MMMLGNAGDLKHVLAYSTSSHAAVLTLLSLQAELEHAMSGRRPTTE